MKHKYEIGKVVYVKNYDKCDNFKPTKVKIIGYLEDSERFQTALPDPQYVVEPLNGVTGVSERWSERYIKPVSKLEQVLK